MDLLTIVSIWTIHMSICNAEATGDDLLYSPPYAPSTVNFQDIYTRTIDKLTVSDEKTSLADEDDFHLTNIPTQFVEFHPKVLKISRVTPPPKIILNASYVKKTSTEPSSTTADYEEPLKVIPITDQHRGVLDILFPSDRVKSFKDVFDSVRKLLSYTFRK